MEEMMKNILDAEKKADEILAAARERAQAVLLAAEERAADISDDARESIKLRTRAFTEQAEAAAKAECDALLAAGRAEAAELARSAGKKLDAAADRIAGRIVNGNR